MKAAILNTQLFLKTFTLCYLKSFGKSRVMKSCIRTSSFQLFGVVNTIIFPVLQMRRWRPRGGHWPAQSHTARKWLGHIVLASDRGKERLHSPRFFEILAIQRQQGDTLTWGWGHGCWWPTVERGFSQCLWPQTEYSSARTAGCPLAGSWGWRCYL